MVEMMKKLFRKNDSFHLAAKGKHPVALLVITREVASAELPLGRAKPRVNHSLFPGEAVLVDQRRLRCFEGCAEELSPETFAALPDEANDPNRKLFLARVGTILRTVDGKAEHRSIIAFLEQFLEPKAKQELQKPQNGAAQV